MEQEEEPIKARFERHRETIGGIEVVEASYADRILYLVAKQRLAVIRSGSAANDCNLAAELFGKDSEEARLYREERKTRNKARSRASKQLWKAVREASTPLPLDAMDERTES